MIVLYIYDRFIAFIGYIDFLIDNYQELLEESIFEKQELCFQLANFIGNDTDKHLTEKDCAEILVGKCNLSQRCYKNLKKILKKNKVMTVSYEKARDFANNLDVGELKLGCNSTECKVTNCMTAHCSIIETIKLIFETPELYHKMEFPADQHDLFSYLKARDSDLFSNLDDSLQTIFIRQTGDNFRAAKHMPTEQLSFSIMNIRGILNSPYGQFTTIIYRGGESRKTLQNHCSDAFIELEKMVRYGIEIILPNGTLERFNVVVFFVADLGFMKELCGKCSSVGTYGCYRCKKHINTWHSKSCDIGEEQTIKEFVKFGNKAVTELGDAPDREKPNFKAFQLAHYGQWVMLQ